MVNPFLLNLNKYQIIIRSVFNIFCFQKEKKENVVYFEWAFNRSGITSLALIRLRISSNWYYFPLRFIYLYTHVRNTKSYACHNELLLRDNLSYKRHMLSRRYKISHLYKIVGHFEIIDLCILNNCSYKLSNRHVW